MKNNKQRGAKDLSEVEKDRRKSLYRFLKKQEIGLILVKKLILTLSDDISVKLVQEQRMIDRIDGLLEEVRRLKRKYR